MQKDVAIKKIMYLKKLSALITIFIFAIKLLTFITNRIKNNNLNNISNQKFIGTFFNNLKKYESI